MQYLVVSKLEPTKNGTFKIRMYQILRVLKIQVFSNVPKIGTF